MFGAYIVRGSTAGEKKGQYVPFEQDKATDRAKVRLQHLEEFGLHIINKHNQRCRVVVICDENTKQPAGTWIMEPKEEATLYRKSTEDKAFVCLKEGTSESIMSGAQQNSPNNGFIDIIFTPELPAPPTPPYRPVNRSTTFEDDDEERGPLTTHGRRMKKGMMTNKRNESLVKTRGGGDRDIDLSDVWEPQSRSMSRGPIQKESKAHVGYGRETGQTFGKTSDITRIDKDNIRTAHLQIVCVDAPPQQQPSAASTTSSTTSSVMIAANPLYVQAV